MLFLQWKIFIDFIEFIYHRIDDISRLTFYKMKEKWNEKIHSLISREKIKKNMLKSFQKMSVNIPMQRLE